MKTTKQNIDAFYASKNIAVVGASVKTRKFGNDIIKEFVNKSFIVYPIHASAETIENLKCYKTIAELPSEVESILISVNKSKTNEIIAEAKQKGIKNIWVQQMSDNAETSNYAADCNLITRQCALMHLEPVTGMHKFHRSIKKFFGKLPK
jgi:predicted CoA-binding protein